LDYNYTTKVRILGTNKGIPATNPALIRANCKFPNLAASMKEMEVVVSGPYKI
jgi:hypothetical protein